MNPNASVTGPLFIAGPTPVIDVTAPPYLAVADAKINHTGSISSSSKSLTISNSSPASLFAPGDVGKAVSVNGAGVGPLSSSNEPSGSVSGTGGISCGTSANVYWVVTLVSDNGTTLTSESIPPNTSGQVTEGTTACTNNGQLTIAPTGVADPGNGATGWLPYASFASGKEVLQPITGSTASCGTLNAAHTGCKFGTGTSFSWTSGSCSSCQLVFDTAQPPVSPVLLSTIASYVSTTNVMLTDAALTTVSTTSPGDVAWGTDNSAAIRRAINACVEPTAVTSSNSGCTVYFPAPAVAIPTTGGVGGIAITGRYFIASGITVPNPASPAPFRNLTLLGGASFGSGDNNEYWNITSTTFSEFTGPFASATIVGSGRFPLMTFGGFVGAGSGDADGLNVINLGFLDGAGAAPAAPGTINPALLIGNTWGAIRLIDVTHPHIERVNAANFSVGYGIEAEGDPSNSSAETQIGTILDSNCSICKIGVWGPQQASDILVEGGTYSGSAVTLFVPSQGGQILSYGADFESDAGVATGSIRIMGTAFRNHSGDAVNYFDCMGCQVMAIKGEQVKATSVGTAVSLDGTAGASHCANDVVVGGAFANYSTNVTVTANCTAATIVTASPVSFAFFCNGSFPSSGMVVVLAPAGSSTGCSVAVGTFVEVPVPSAGTLRNLYVQATNTGGSATVEVHKNNGALPTALSCSLTTSCSDTTDAVSVNAGDTISIRITSPGTALGNVRATLQLQ